ncbi:hypothetical protein EJ02DRAFT_123662 [Clathrospora elynae]|uniref:Reverse transcriptase Ty1/copia-type domain-containing protein n=1 Tax=Clathrospora elynae TaxID=706981 RepID=A0A6A5S7P8_9PLEO|nr:hypothetical protein EJ02DRAFT_123662 [Clathrospora elynae]
MALAPTFFQRGMSMELRDITQAYPQAQTNLKRTILAHLPTELVSRYPVGTLLRVIKPLYGIAEAGVHWWTTYHGHHSTFSSLEEKKLEMAQFRSKPKAVLTPDVQLDVNSCTLTMDTDKAILNLRQKGQWGKIKLVDIKASDCAQQYTEQRARGAYIASEIYGMVNGFDIGIAIATTLRMITERLGLAAVPLVICTDSYSLYECLVKLGTTKEKRLMIDIMALRQSYERREITEIRWINGDDNPADAFTKASPNRALERFIDSNEVTVRIEGWVQRPTASH